MNGMETALYVGDSIISTLVDEKDPNLSEIKSELRISSDMQDRLAKSKEQQIETKKIEGKLYSVAYKPICNNKSEIVGILSIAMPQDEIVTAKKNVQIYIFMIGLAGILFAILFTALTSKSIVNPIRKLVSDTKVIAEGNLIYKSDINGKDEVGRLASEFNAPQKP